MFYQGRGDIRQGDEHVKVQGRAEVARGKCLCGKAYEIFLEMRYMGCVHGQPGGVFMTAKLPQPARAVLQTMV